MIEFSINVPIIDNTPIEELARKKIGANRIDKCIVIKKSIDARRKDKLSYNYRVAVEVKNEQKYISKEVHPFNLNVVTLEDMCKDKKVDFRPIIVGSGPAGLFCALSFAYMGAKPVVLERGADVDARTEKINEFFRSLVPDENTNVQFGEGGAGTFSDGKLNTNLHNEYLMPVLREFVKHGAPEEILYLNKPHIGTDNLVGIVKSMRETIVNLGGEIHFLTRMTDMKIENGSFKAAITDKGVFEGDRLYLAIGHSARDTFEMLFSKGLIMESKTFSMGVRIEHKRKDIDYIQYGEYGKYLPAADYKLAVKTDSGRSLYTFCMCPGGTVINASSEKGGVCVNGMSEYRRDGENSNSAILVNVGIEDWKSEHPLAGIEYQRKAERATFAIGNSYKPVVQLYGDLVNGKETSALREIVPSVKTGYVFGDLRACLDSAITDTIVSGVKAFGKKMKKFDDYGAVLTGIETRSSSPVKIPRDEKFRSSISNIYPLGEGAGYAGGIMSAAVDGIKGAFADI